MKVKIFVLVLVVTLFQTSVVFSAGKPSNDIPRKNESVVEFRGEFYQSDKGESFWKAETAGIWKNHIGGLGFRADDIEELDVYSLEGFGFLSFKNVNLILGYKYKDCGDSDFDYVFPGLEVFGGFTGVNYSISFKNFFVLEGEDNGYFDTFAYAAYPLSSKLSLGGMFIHDYYWSETKDDHTINWLLLGPFARYQFNKSWFVRLRLARAWDFVGDESSYYDRIRLTVEFHY